MIKIWLLYAGYAIFVFIFVYIILRILQTKPEIKDYGILTKYFVKYRLWKQKILQKYSHKEEIKNFPQNLWQKILRRIKIEALKIEVWASEKLQTKKEDNSLN